MVKAISSLFLHVVCVVYTSNVTSLYGAGLQVENIDGRKETERDVFILEGNMESTNRSQNFLTTVCHVFTLWKPYFFW